MSSEYAIEYAYGPTARPQRPTWRALVAVTTCQREPFLRRCLPQLARSCGRDPRLSLVVSLDGDDAASRRFCDSWQVPLLYSDEREGVGLSKNRLLSRYPDFDYYFFLEDDVEVVDGSVFASHVALHEATGIHHMSLFPLRGARKPTHESSALGHRLLHCMYGHADFNFFTREGLDRVGGWHPLFAQYRRWGHTEHSYRFPRAGLAPAPFNVPVQLVESCIWHSPPSVTRWTGIEMDADEIAAPERELLDQGLLHVPLQTLSAYHDNALTPGQLPKLADAASGFIRYPLLAGRERRRALSDYCAALVDSHRRTPTRVAAAAFSLAMWPTNPSLRHAVKMSLRDARRGLARRRSESAAPLRRG